MKVAVEHRSAYSYLRGQTDAIRVEDAEFMRQTGEGLLGVLMRLGCSHDALAQSYRRTHTPWPTEWPWKSHHKKEEKTT